MDILPSCSTLLIEGGDPLLFKILSGPETAEKKNLATIAFAKALIEVAGDVDDDDDPKEAIKEYGTEVLAALTLHQIGGASKIAGMAKKAWRPQKIKKPVLYNGYQKRWPTGASALPTPPASPVVPAPSVPVGSSGRPMCPVCGRTGHNEATCYVAHPELRVVRPAP